MPFLTMLMVAVALSEETPVNFEKQIRPVAGGPSQFELFDYKPELTKWDGQEIPASFIKGKRFAFMDTSFKGAPKLLGSRRTVMQQG